MRSSLLLLMLLAGCEEDLLANMHDAGSVDAADAMLDAPGRCTAPMTDAHPALHTIYANFDGVMLSKCTNGMASDSRANCTDIVPGDTTFPPFMDGNPARDGFIGQILYAAQRALAPYSIDIVTTRPASGSYHMMVFGGTPALVGAPANIFGIAPATCEREQRNLVSLIFDQGQMPTSTDYSSTILSDLAMMSGIPVTTGPINDCACRTCPYTMLCTYGTNSPVNTDPNKNCGLTTVDEPAVLQEVLGCR